MHEFRLYGLAIALAIAGACGSNGGSAGDGVAGIGAPADPERRLCAETCIAASNKYRATICRREKGADRPMLSCVVTSLETGAKAYGVGSGGRCVAPMGAWEWVFIWEGALPVLECEPVAARWRPCGCGTRIYFREGDCV
jgi:hypothetical protein